MFCKEIISCLPDGDAFAPKFECANNFVRFVASSLAAIFLAPNDHFDEGSHLVVGVGKGRRRWRHRVVARGGNLVECVHFFRAHDSNCNSDVTKQRQSTGRLLRVYVLRKQGKNACLLSFSFLE